MWQEARQPASAWWFWGLAFQKASPQEGDEDHNSEPGQLRFCAGTTRMRLGRSIKTGRAGGLFVR